MKNDEIAKILYEIASYLEMREVSFKPYAYKRAALALDDLEFDINDVYRLGGVEALQKIPGIGKSIAQKIEEYLKTGKIGYYDKLKRALPAHVKELTAVEGIGPKTVRTLYEELGVLTLGDLEKAARLGKIKKLSNFGEKSEKNILESIAFLEKNKGRFLLSDITLGLSEIESALKTLKETDKIDIAGSIRRKKETIGDADILVSVCGQKGTPSFQQAAGNIMDFFVSLPGVVKVQGKGKTKTSVKMKQGFNVDLRVVATESYGAALQYFTGSKEHNILIRKIAISKGLKLNEYGLFRGKERISGRKEKEIYQALGMAYIEPELRENRGEIKASINQAQGKGKGLPNLIGYTDIKGDLHCHSSWDGGKNTIEDMARLAIKMGYSYLGISDHTKFLRIERGLNEKQLALQKKEIQELNNKFHASGLGFRVLHGAETNILKDGSIDIDNESLRELDYAIAGIHSSFKMSQKEMSKRMICAMKNPNIKIISHPTGRILKKRDEHQVDFGKILRAARQFNVALEINSCPERLDLNDLNIRRAKEAGVKMTINSDAHHRSQLKNMRFGISQARRGWAEKKDIINTKSLNKLLRYFSQSGFR